MLLIKVSIIYDKKLHFRLVYLETYVFLSRVSELFPMFMTALTLRGLQDSSDSTRALPRRAVLLFYTESDFFPAQSGLRQL